MSALPPALAEIMKLERQLRTTLARAEPPLPASCIAQLAKIVSHVLQHQLRGHHYVYPGMRKMASWAGGRACIDPMTWT